MLRQLLVTHAMDCHMGSEWEAQSHNPALVYYIGTYVHPLFTKQVMFVMLFQMGIRWSHMGKVIFFFSQKFNDLYKLLNGK